MELYHILLLLKLKIRILINGFLKGATKKRIHRLFALVGGAIFFFLIYQWILEIFEVLAQHPTIGMSLIDNAIIIVFLGFFLFLLVSGITVSIHYLFISSDLPLLMAAPISNNTIFTFKLIEAIFANSTLFFFMGSPIFIAYGLVNNAPWFYYPLMIINVLVFLSIPISIAFLGALFIVRIIPPRKAREFTAIFLGIVSLGIWLVLQIVRASVFDRGSQDFNPQSIESLYRLSYHSLVNLLPSTWAARALSGFAHAHIMSINFVPLTIFMIIIFSIGIQLSQNAFKQGFIGSEEAVTLNRKKRAKKEEILGVTKINTIFSGIPGTIVIRDFKLLFRDTRQLINILLFAAMMTILPLLQRTEQFASGIAIYYPYIFLIIFGTMISGLISSRLIPLEGKSFWITMLIPQSTVKLITGKFLLGFSLSIMLSWIATGIIGCYFHHPIRVVTLVLIATFCLCGVHSSLGVLISTYFARFDWDHPKRMLSWTGGFLLSVSSLVIIAIIGGLVALIYFIGNHLQFPEQLIILCSIVIVLIISISVVVMANLGSAKKLEKLEWQF